MSGVRSLRGAASVHVNRRPSSVHSSMPYRCQLRRVKACCGLVLTVRSGSD